jgi:hypothetical protein
VDSGHFLQIPERVCNEFGAFLIARLGFSPKKSKQARIGGKNNTGRLHRVESECIFIFVAPQKR